MMNRSSEDWPISRTLDQLGSRQPATAWAQFLEIYSPLILRVVRAFEREPDSIGDCFLYVAEQLSRNQFRRLRRFKPEGRARFATWLQAVVRNLCLDWHRKEFGRHRIFQSIGRLGHLEQEVFRLSYLRGFHKEECFFELRTTHPALTREQVDASLERVEEALTPRQRWLLEARNPRVESLEADRGEVHEGLERQIPDSRPNPQGLVAMEEQQRALARALGWLSRSERLLLKLRYDRGLTLLQIAGLMRLKDAQTADRRIREVLERLRRHMT